MVNHIIKTQEMKDSLSKKHVSIASVFLALTFLSFMSEVFVVRSESPSEEPLIVMSNVTQDPEQIFPGEIFFESFSLTNVGDGEAQMTQLLLDISSPFAMVESSSNLFVGDLQPGKSRLVQVQISLDKNALVGVYSISFTIKYKDLNGESYVESGSFGVQVFGEPQLLVDEILVDPIPLTPGQDGLMRITLTNVGNDVAYDVSIKVFGGRNILSSHFAYIAKVGERPEDILSLLSQRSESVDFPISIDGGINPGTYLLNITVAYKDDLEKTYQLSKLFEIKILSTQPLIPNFYVVVAVIVAVVAVVGYFLYFWKPESTKS